MSPSRHHLFSIMFSLRLISIHIPAGDYYLRINNNTSLKIFSLLYITILYLTITAPHNKIQERINNVIGNVSFQMFSIIFLEGFHRKTAPGREVGMLLSIWFPALLTLVQGNLLLEPCVFAAILILPKSFGCWGHGREGAMTAEYLSVVLLVRAWTRIRTGSFAWGQNVWSTKKA